MHLPANRPNTNILLNLVAWVCVLCGGSAYAGKRVVILDFDGMGAVPARTAVARMLRGEHDVVARALLESEAGKLHVPTHCDPMMIPGLATVLQAEAVICGQIRRRRLTLKVFNGGDGALMAKVRLPLRRGAMTAATMARATRRLDPIIARTWNWGGEETRSSAPAKAAPPMLTERTTIAAPPEPNAWEGNDQENPLASRHRRSRVRASATVSARPEAVRGRASHAVRLSAGPAFLLRRNYSVYEAAVPRDAQGWKTTPVAGLALDGELFPAAWFTQGWASNIGLGLSYSRYFGLSWRNDGDPEDHTATHQVLTADVRGRYRHEFGPRALVVSGHFGYRRLTFAMNDGATPAVIPDVALSSLDMGLEAQMDLLPRWIALSARFSYLPTLGRGEIVQNGEYGAGSGTGLLFGGAASGQIMGPVGWNLSMDYTRYTVVFDGDPTASRHAAKARDRYLTSVLMLTYTN